MLRIANNIQKKIKRGDILLFCWKNNYKQACVSIFTKLKKTQ